MTPPPINPRPELEERLRFETLIADLSSKFVNPPSGEVGGEIMEAECRFCEFLGLDFSMLWQWSDEAPGYFKLTHFYSAVIRRASTPVRWFVLDAKAMVDVDTTGAGVQQSFRNGELVFLGGVLNQANYNSRSPGDP